jgi:unsaturated chondroitin disaccharide hydrolase
MRLLVLLAAVLTAASCAREQDADADNEAFERAWSYAGQQLLRANEGLAPSQHPRSTRADGRWSTVGAGDWTSGFYPGCLWLLYEKTGGAAWRTSAEAQTTDLDGQKNNRGDHDVGFRIMSSYGQGLRLTGEAAYRDVIHTAARSLATRFDPDVGCTRSWSFGTWRFPVIVDNMMNLELLLWSAANGGDPGHRTMAVSHALKTLENHVRPDGGTYHVVDYDPDSGRVLARQTHQGLADESTWARGQAWGLYGFTMVHRYTNDARFLDAATRLAEYTLARLPADSVAYWDYMAPLTPAEPRDSSAAAITASALLELSARTPSVERKVRYREAALDILRSLAAAPYLASGSPSAGILLHGVGSKPAGTEVDVSLIYGDYYFLEALRRYQRGIS